MAIEECTDCLGSHEAGWQCAPRIMRRRADDEELVSIARAETLRAFRDAIEEAAKRDAIRARLEIALRNLRG